MKKHFVSIVLAAAAMVAALGAYIVNLKVSAERAEVEALRGSIARDMADIDALRAELRTRARLPQLQQWNDVALRLGAPGPQQLLGAPVQLAAFAPGAAQLPAAATQPTPTPAEPPLTPAAEPLPAPAPIIAANVADTPLRAVAATIDNLGDARLGDLAARARGDQAAAANEALGLR